MDPLIVSQGRPGDDQQHSPCELGGRQLFVDDQHPADSS